LIFDVPSAGKDKPRANFDRAKFDKLIAGQGQRFTWDQAEKCPCAESEHSDAAKAGCPVCGGVGWTWHDPLEVRAIARKVDRTPEAFDDVGEWAQGGIYLTLRPEQQPGFMDRFTALDLVMVFQDFGVRSSDPLDQLRMPIVRRTLDLAGGETTVGVRRLRLRLPNGDGGPLRVEGTDFEVSNGGIDWTLGDGLGTAPAVGQGYTATYYASPVYHVMHVPFVRDTWTKKKAPTGRYQPMPVNVFCRLRIARNAS
jgi:hypothetical protein